MSVPGASVLTDICAALIDIGVGGLDAGERPGPGDTAIHHIPFVPQTPCCKTDPTDSQPFGTDGSLSVSAQSVFSTIAFPLARSAGDPVETPGRPGVHLWLRLWRCFPTIDEHGRYDIADAEIATTGLQDDLVVLWAALQRAICDGELADLVAGCKSAILWEARPIRPQAGCAGWEFHLMVAWPPLQFPAPAAFARTASDSFGLA